MKMHWGYVTVFTFVYIVIPFGGIDAALTFGATSFTSDAALTLDVASGSALTLGGAATDILTFTGTVSGASPLLFEGATADDFELLVAVTDPTADRTITLPNVDGTIITTGNLSSFLTGDDDLMAEANRIRAGFGLKPLRRD